MNDDQPTNQEAQPCIKQNTTVDQLAHLLTYLRYRRLQVQRFLANGTAKSVDAVDTITIYRKQLSRVAISSKYVINQLSLERPRILDNWSEKEIPFEKFIDEAEVSNLPLATKFVHVKGNLSELMHPEANLTSLPKIFRSWEIIHSRHDLRRIRMVECGIGDEVVTLICREFPLLAWLNLRTNTLQHRHQPNHRYRRN